MVSKFVQPNFPAQSATVYKTSIDDSVSVMAEQAAIFAVHEQPTPDMTVAIDAGRRFSGRSLVLFDATSSGTITAPSSNPRIDRIVADRVSGAISTVTGAEGASPIAPAIAAGTVPLAQIDLVVSQSSIINADITDERDFNLFGMATGEHERKTNNYTAVAGDSQRFIEMDKATAHSLSLPDAASVVFEGWFIYVKNTGVGLVTVDTVTSDLIDDAASITLRTGQSTIIFCDGGGFWTVGKGSNSIPSTTVMIFHQSAAPTGWTKDTASTLNNSALRLVTNTAWSSGKKGATAFTSVFGSGKNSGNYTLLEADIPSHTHTSDIAPSDSGFNNDLGTDEPSVGATHESNATGGDGAHQHSLSLDLHYVNMIIASKN